jgi:hypothetical protein
MDFCIRTNSICAKQYEELETSIIQVTSTQSNMNAHMGIYSST